jgi:hypothetical protein
VNNALISLKKTPLAKNPERLCTAPGTDSLSPELSTPAVGKALSLRELHAAQTLTRTMLILFNRSFAMRAMSLTALFIPLLFSAPLMAGEWPAGAKNQFISECQSAAGQVQGVLLMCCRPRKR